jgi:hypothetical protein
MRKLWKSILESYELPLDMVLESKEVVKEKARTQEQEAIAQQKSQQRIQAMQQAGAFYQQQQKQFKQ